MSDEQNPDEVVELPEEIAPGLRLAHNPQPEPAEGAHRRRRGQHDPMAALRQWTPRTRLGRMVRNGQVLTIEQAFETGLPIREVEIVDALLPGLEDEVVNVNMIQRMTDSGRRVRFNVMAAVGNEDGYVGLAICKGKEVAGTIRKAIDTAKLSVIPVMRGNGSWESGGGAGTSIPFKVQGRAASTRVTLMPAPAGKGLVIGEKGRIVLRLAGITDIYSRTGGQTRTTINFAKATFNALEMLNKSKVSEEQKKRLYMTSGRLLS
jgi:small subunit ribosomal protein S5